MCIVITENVAKDDGFDLLTLHLVSRDLIQLFLLQSGEKALNTGVVKAVSSTAEALNEPVCYKLSSEGIACVLAATVTVKDSEVLY